jgi:RNA polymerase II-associated factor 1
MIDIPTTPARYAEPERLEAIANMQPFPMIVDAEMGLPLDLGRWDCLWEDNGDDSGLLCVLRC